MKHLQIKITGLVQGVWFRKHTQEIALQLDINGFVMNMPDNYVYIEAVGNDEQLQKFIEWCHKGSPKSKVQKVEVEESNNQKFFEGFEIRK